MTRILKKSTIIILIMLLLLNMLPVVNNAGITSMAKVSTAYKNAKPITYTITGNQAKDIVGVAKTQKGQGEYERYYSKKLGRDVVKTAYGDYFDYNYEWCAVFVCWCARKAGIKKDIIPYSTFADPNKFKGKYYKRGKIKPQTGDLIFYGNKTHVGIVTSCKDGYVNTIEGNTASDKQGNGYVASHKYKLTNTWIMGYVRPNYKKEAKKYTVEFVSGTTDSVTGMPSAQKITYGKKLNFTELSQPKRTGYKFVGWKNSYDGKIYKNNIVINGNRTFTAQWEKINDNLISSTVSYGVWKSSEPTVIEKVVSEDGKTVTTNEIESKSVHKSFSWYCDCKKICWKNSKGSCKYCGGKTKNFLSIYSSTKLGNTGYIKDTSDSSYILPKTIGTSSPGKFNTIYCMYYGGGRVESWTTKSKSGHIYAWQSSTEPATVYRIKTTVKKYTEKVQ